MIRNFIPYRYIQKLLTPLNYHFKSSKSFKTAEMHYFYNKFLLLFIHYVYYNIIFKNHQKKTLSQIQSSSKEFSLIEKTNPIFLLILDCMIHIIMEIGHLFLDISHCDDGRSLEGLCVCVLADFLFIDLLLVFTSPDLVNLQLTWVCTDIKTSFGLALVEVQREVECCHNNVMSGVDRVVRKHMSVYSSSAEDLLAVQHMRLSSGESHWLQY
jgi:hypothetical protein